MDFTNFLKIILECVLSNKPCEHFKIEESATILAGSLVILYAIIKYSYSVGVYLYDLRKQHILKRNLHPFYSDLEISKSTKYYITTKGQNIAPSRENEPGDTHAFAIRENLINKFIRDGFRSVNTDNRFFIVLADSGMGKTTFMLNLYLRHIKFSLIRRKFKIKLFPLAYPNVLQIIKDLDNKNQTILLLDALDEDQDAVLDYKKKLTEIIDIAKEFRSVLFTCRTQFFPNEDEENIETGIMKFGTEKGFHIFRKIYLSPFNDDDIKLYLNKKYGRFNPWNKALKRKAKFIVKQSPNLVVRPMLLSYIDDLTKNKIKYNFTFQIYNELINKWIDREARRVSIKRMETQKQELHRFSKEIALYIYNEREDNNNLTISAKDIITFSEKHHISLNEWELTGRSLLNRDGMGRYKFAHKSILEFFIATEYFNNSDFKVDFNGFDNVEYFLYEYLKDLLAQFNSVCSYSFSSKGSWDNKNYENLFIEANLISRHADEKEINNKYSNTIFRKSLYMNGSFMNSSKHKEFTSFTKNIITLIERNEKTEIIQKKHLKNLTFEYIFNILSLKSADTAFLRFVEDSFTGYIYTSVVNDLNLKTFNEIIALSMYIKKEENVDLSKLHILKILKKLFYLELILDEVTWNRTYIDLQIHLPFLKHLNNLTALFIALPSSITNVESISYLEKLTFLHLKCKNVIVKSSFYILIRKSNLKVIIIETIFIEEQLNELKHIFQKDDVLSSNNLIFINLHT